MHPRKPMDEYKIISIADEPSEMMHLEHYQVYFRLTKIFTETYLG